MPHDADFFERELSQSVHSVKERLSSQLAGSEAETTRVEAIAPTPANSIYVFGKLPSSSGFVRAGTANAAEALFENWLQHALQCAGGVLPARAVRFVVAPDATPMIGVWVPSCDRERNAFPLVVLRRLPQHASDGRDLRDGRDVRDVPWTLVLRLYATYLDALESCLLPGAYDDLESLYAAANAYQLPAPTEFATELQAAGDMLGKQRVHLFASRNALTQTDQSKPWPASPPDSDNADHGPSEAARGSASVRARSAEPAACSSVTHEQSTISATTDIAAREHAATGRPARAAEDVACSRKVDGHPSAADPAQRGVSSRRRLRPAWFVRRAALRRSIRLIELLTAARGSKPSTPWAGRLDSHDSRAPVDRTVRSLSSTTRATPDDDGSSARARTFTASHEIGAATQQGPGPARAGSHDPGELAVDWMARVLVGMRRLCEHPAPYPTLELRTHADFDLYVWLELLRALLDPSDRPRAVFWCPADGRALVDLGDPSAATLLHLGRPRDRSTPDAVRSGQEPVIDLRSVRQRGVEYGEFGPGLAADGGQAGVTAGDLRRELDARARSLIDRNAALNELVGALAVCR